MATTLKVVALLLPVLMLSVSPCFALPSWRDFRVDDNKLAPASSGYVEPSSRDLDIGFTVGGDDDLAYPIRSGHVATEGYRDKSLEDFNIGVIRDRLVAMYPSSGAAEGGRVEPGGGRVFYTRYPSSGAPEGGRVEPGGELGLYPRYPSSGAVEGGRVEPGGGRVFYSSYPSSGAAEGGRVDPGGGRVFYPKSDVIEYPGVISQPLDYKVGELKLRSDKGYQLSMHVPPSSVGDRPGVLKIDMKATLYRPIYY